jgi:ribonuclease-3
LNWFPFRRAFYPGKADRKLAKSIRNILGYRPGNISLYHQAFLHKSASQESSNGLKINNERLEFLGDAILDAVAADYLFRKFPTRDEGFLTEMRSKLVSRATLNRLSQKMGVDTLILHDPNQQGAFRSSKGDAFEALLGAVYLDKGFEFTRKLILDRIIQRYFDIEELVNQELNYKSRIIEWGQREKRQLQFRVVGEIGQGYNKQYVVELLVDGQTLERGQDYSIKGAEQNASERSWQKIITSTIDLKPENG